MPHFLVLETEGSSRISGLVGEMVTEEKDLADHIMYDTPRYMTERADGRCRSSSPSGLPPEEVDGCFMPHTTGPQGTPVMRVPHLHDHMLRCYAKFDFVDEGLSGPVHGGVAWHHMRLMFCPPQENPETHVLYKTHTQPWPALRHPSDGDLTPCDRGHRQLRTVLVEKFRQT